MRTKSLTQVCNITTGKLDANAEVKDGKYPFFTCAPEPSKIDVYAFDDDVVLLAGNNAQGNFHIQRYTGKFNAYQRTYIITTKDGYDIDYIKYSLELSLQQLKRAAQGSQTKFLTMQILESFQVLDLPYEKQKLLVGSIREIDRKIIINNRINDNLEQQAKLLYDYWFTQFDFPDENGKPYRSSGGEMVWNETLKREIPKGWEVTTINEMTTNYRGVSYDKKDLLPNAESGVLVLRGNNIQNNRLIYDENVAYIPQSFVSEEQRIRAHDIILTMSSGSKEHIGKCTMFQYDSPHTYGAFLTKFSPHTDKVYYVYLSMISDYFKKKIKAICNGTGINNLTNETFDNLIFPKPEAKVLKQFEKIATSLFEKMGKCEQENHELTTLRDWLLPMLMNGQATVE